MQKLGDTITIGAIAGFIGTGVIITLNWLAGWLGLAFTPPWVVSGNILLTAAVLYTTAGILLGLAIEFLFGAGFGIVLAIALRLAGTDYYLAKGLGVGALFFVGSTGILQAVAHAAPWTLSEITAAVVAFSNFIILGAVSSWVIAKNAAFSPLAAGGFQASLPQPATKPLEEEDEDQ